MSVRDLGKSGGFLAVGEVVNVEDDPSQSGRVRVRWLTGSAVQHDIGDDDLPWIPSIFPTSNPSLGQTGGPHTGLQKGSRVVGVPVDGSGQDFMLMGTIVKGGEGGIDEPGQFDSDIPQPAKVNQNGGESQPRYGDVNGVVTKQSIVQYAESEGGTDKRATLFGQVDDPIGTLQKAIV